MNDHEHKWTRVGPRGWQCECGSVKGEIIVVGLAGCVHPTHMVRVIGGTAQWCSSCGAVSDYGRAISTGNRETVAVGLWTAPERAS